MKAHPKREALALLALGKLGGRRKDEILVHLRGCPGCKTDLARLAAVTAPLSSAAEEKDGELSVKLNLPPDTFTENLQKAAQRAHREAKRRRMKIESIVERIVRDLIPSPVDLDAQPAALASRRSGRPVAWQQKDDREFSALLASLLEKLLDPEVGLSTRLSWLTEVSRHLQELADSQAGTNASDKPGGTRKTARRKKG